VGKLNFDKKFMPLYFAYSKGFSKVRHMMMKLRKNAINRYAI